MDPLEGACRRIEVVHLSAQPATDAASLIEALEIRDDDWVGRLSLQRGGAGVGASTVCRPPRSCDERGLRGQLDRQS
jgi:hypothetical protein